MEYIPETVPMVAQPVIPLPDPVTINLFTRRVALWGLLTSLVVFGVTWGFYGCQCMIDLHHTLWGLDLAVVFLTLLLLLGVGCFGPRLRSAPLIYLVYIIFVALLAYLATAGLTWLPQDVVMLLAAGMVAKCGANYFASLTSKGHISLGTSVLYALAAEFIVYEVFLIFTTLGLIWLVVISLYMVISSIFATYNNQTTLPGPFYGLNVMEEACAGSIIAFLEWILMPVRICEFLGRTMRPVV